MAGGQAVKELILWPKSNKAKSYLREEEKRLD